MKTKKFFKMTGMTRKEAAAKCGVSYASIGNWFRKGVIPERNWQALGIAEDGKGLRSGNVKEGPSIITKEKGETVPVKLPESYDLDCRCGVCDSKLNANGLCEKCFEEKQISESIKAEETKNENAAIPQITAKEIQEMKEVELFKSVLNAYKLACSLNAESQAAKDLEQMILKAFCI